MGYVWKRLEKGIIFVKVENTIGVVYSRNQTTNLNFTESFKNLSYCESMEHCKECGGLWWKWKREREREGGGKRQKARKKVSDIKSPKTCSNKNLETERKNWMTEIII